MQKWRDLIFNRGFLYFIISIIVPFLGCIILLQKVHSFEFSDVDSHTYYSDTGIKDRSLSLVFVGDTMLDRNVRKIIDKEGFDYVFEKIAPFIKEYNIGVLNLEGVYSHNNSISTSQNEVLRFTFDPKGVGALYNSGFRIVSQANNHTNDFGRSGAEESKKILDDAYIKAVGDYFNESDPVYLEARDIKVAIIAFNEFSNENLESTKQKIVYAKEQNNFVVLLPHWGIEYKRFPNEKQKLLAHEWIDLGADMVIGAHPHVIQTVEEYKGKPIFYSLGNFIFDQYFSKETQIGLAVSIKLDKDSFELDMHPLKINYSVPELMSKTEAESIIDDLLDDSNVSSVWRERLLKGKTISFKRNIN